MLNVDTIAPVIDLPATKDDKFVLANATGPVVIFFYPKDDTPGCTTEAKDFTQLQPQFDALGIAIVGISPDPLKKHEKFQTKHDLEVNLAADEDKATLEAYGVWVEKSMYGRQYMGVERSTFLIGKDGKVAQI